MFLTFWKCLGRFYRRKSWWWELIQDNSPPFQSPLLRWFVPLYSQTGTDNPKGDSFHSFQWWSEMDFLECWTSWLEGDFHSIVGLQNTQVFICSLFFSFLTSLSTSVQGSVDFPFHRPWRRWWEALPQVPSLTLELQIPAQCQGSLACRSQKWLKSQNLKYCECEAHFGLVTAL